jgi:hypothetical protein
VFLKAVFRLPMERDEISVFQKCTSRDSLPAAGFKEACAVVGRRRGKSRIGALIGVFIGCFYDFKPYLAAGEVGMILILARNRDQAGVVFGCVSGIMQAAQAFEAMIVRQSSDEIELSNGIVIKVATSISAGCVAAPLSARSATRWRLEFRFRFDQTRTPKSSGPCDQRWQRSRTPS